MNHAKSVVKIENNHDLELICRCMIEGLAILSYAKKNPDYIASWYAQGDIEDFRLLDKKLEIRCSVSLEQKDYIESNAITQQKHIKKKALKDIRLKKRNIIPKDFPNILPPMGKLISELSKDSDHWDAVYEVYDRFSKWQHWNPACFSNYITLRNKECIIEENYQFNLISYTYALMSLIETSKIFNEVLGLSKEHLILEHENTLLEIFYKEKPLE